MAPVRFGAALIGLVLAVGCLEPRGWVSERRERQLSANELHNLGVDHLEAGDLPSCVRVYERVVSRKRTAAAYTNLAYCQRELGERAAAIAAYEEALRIDPEFVPAWAGRAILLARAGDAAAFAEHQARLERLDPAAARAVAAAPEDRLGTPDRSGPLPTPRQAPRGIMGN